MFNWFKTTLLMAAIVALFGVIGAMIGGKGGMLMALLFGGFWRGTDGGGPVTGPQGAALAGGPMWEGWIEPPAY
ncbi:MAG TPA: hypothetical protein PK479_08265, partial [Novosphingobium sp.]|nr:hypothetical protein [Novosphingobium sp.]